MRTKLLLLRIVNRNDHVMVSTGSFVDMSSFGRLQMEMNFTHSYFIENTFLGFLFRSAVSEDYNRGIKDYNRDIGAL